MQAVPVADPVVPSATTFSTLIPGPFILLLALPAIPLLLFSVGARPPDTSNLPFSTDDLWQTTAAITVAGAVVLCLGFWPGAFSGIGSWVTEGAVEGGGFVRGLVGVGGSTSQGIGDGETYTGQQDAWARHYPRPPMAPRQPLAPGFAGSFGWPPTLGSPYQLNFQGRHPINGLSGIQEAQPPGDRPQRLLCSADAAVVPRHFESLADKHLAALREGPLASWYSPSPPNRLAALLTVIVSVALLIVITGIIIGDSYEHKDKDKGDSSSSSRTSSTESSAWLARELRKRKDEAKEPETTEKRVAKENKEWEDKLAKRPDREREKYMKERTKDVTRLRESLRNSGLPLVALDVPGLKKANARARSKDEKKVTKAEGGTGEKKSFGLALKRVFLGRQLADALERRKAESRPEEGTAVVTTMLRSQVAAEGGPGWKAADDAVAHAAVSSGAARAEALAKRMAAEKAGAA